jgi:DNA-binding response OmpR family regulator
VIVLVFHYEELVARIHAMLRRAQPAARARLAAGPIAIDRDTRRVTVHGFAVALAAKEFELLAKLASEPTRVFTKEELLRVVVLDADNVERPPAKRLTATLSALIDRGSHTSAAA